MKLKVLEDEQYKNYNIITDNDIVITDPQNIGNSLSDVINKHDEKIERLESNVKWMYRYGALGSGGTGGNGGGTNTKWKFQIWKDGRQLIPPKTKLMYPGDGYYLFKFEVHGGGNDTFNVSCNHYYNKNYYTDNFKLTPDNGFSIETRLRLEGNHDLIITVQNQSTGDYYEVDGSEHLVYPVVTSAYNLSAYYVKGKDPKKTNRLEKYTVTNHTIRMSNVVSTGLMIAIDYNIAVELDDETTRVEYNDWEDRNIVIDNTGMHITYPDGSVENDETFDVRISNGSGLLYLPLAANIADDDRVSGFLNKNENASFKQVSISVISQMSGEVEPTVFGTFELNDNLIPNGLFLNVRTDAGGLYTSIDIAKVAPQKSQMTIGDVIFKVTPYYDDIDTARPYNLSVYQYSVDVSNNNEETQEGDIISTSLIDQKTSDVVISCSKPGIKRIMFVLVSGETYIKSYYINVKSFTSRFEWYPNITIGEQTSVMQPEYLAAYKRHCELTNMTSSSLTLSENNTIQMTANDRPKTINFVGVPTADIKFYDNLMGVGLQYYSVNDTSKPILSINRSGSTETSKRTYSIFVYQDKISILSSDTSVDSEGNIGNVSSNDIGIFIPLEDNYEPANTEKFHLFNIYKRLEYVDDDGNRYRSFASYIDGILEGLQNEFIPTAILYDSITLYPGNYTLNLLEYSMWYHGSLDDGVTWLEDIDIDRYYKGYVEKIIYRGNHYSDDEKKLFDEFNKFEYDSKNRIIVSSESASNIAKYVSCPILVLNFDDQGAGVGKFIEPNVDNFMEWFEENLKEGMPDTTKNVPVTLQWCDGKSKQLEIIKLPGADKAVSFSVDRQGSSTKTYRCKNLELHAPTSQNEDTNYIFSPNMKLHPETSDELVFLPESSFTLKADVVDSSHTNNNAIGKFVNDNTTPFSGARTRNNYQNGTRLLSCIKNNLEGFPMLLFLNTSYPEYSGGTKIGTFNKSYFLGIYNFNLGRNSAFNLGYKDLSKLEDIIDNLGQDAKEGFVIYEISHANNEQMPTVAGGEVQTNDTHYDFSQYADTKLLFGDPEYGIEGMWGDLICTDNTEDDVTTALQELCRRTSLAGGYIFNQLGKEMSNEPSHDGKKAYGYDKGYSKLTTQDGQEVNVINGEWIPAIGRGEKYVEWVPNYHYQAYRQQDGSTVTWDYRLMTDNNGNTIFGQLNDLKNLIISYEEDNRENIPMLDYRSLTEYYTTMMAFGLVDSIKKNLNVKSWNSGQTFYLAFYDMDTGLGKNNAGTYINYFAFSDYWRSVYQQKTYENGQKYLDLSQVNIVRDYSPPMSVEDEHGSSFFDAPSTYLFSIAKYAKSLFFNNLNSDGFADVNMYDPSNIWGKWRNKNGCLRNADYFMKNYFNHHLSTIPTEAFNFNYRYKYLVKDDSQRAFDGTNFIKFHGRGIAYTTYWLDGRLHILDAYFNLNKIDDTIAVVNGVPIKAPKTDDLYVPSDNEDVYILQDAFTNVGQEGQYTQASSGAIVITAKEYAPFIMKYNDISERYLFPADPKAMTININFPANVTAMFCGSKMWTEIASIVPFIKQNYSFTMNSKYISSLSGNSRTCTSWVLDTPALRVLRLTGEKYSGTISFTSQTGQPKYQNLDEINLSNTAIKLTLSNIPIRKLHLNDMKSGADLQATGLTRLEDVLISGYFEDIKINSWSNNITFPSGGSFISSKTMTVINDRFDDAKITVTGNNELLKLSLQGFSHIVIKNCPSLKEIEFIDDLSVNPSPVKTIDVVLSSFSNEEENYFKIGERENEVDLTNFINLEGIRFANTTIKYIHLPKSDSVHNAGNKRKIKLITDGPTSSTGALSNCKNFVNFTNEVYNDLYITGPRTFMNCGILSDNGYKLVKNMSNELSNIYVDSSCESLEETFLYSERVGPITYEIASEFLRTRCTGSEVENVVSIRQMFRRNSIRYDYDHYYQEYISAEPYCSLPLWGFTSCTVATDVFSNNDINFFNRYMFEEYKTNHSGKKLLVHDNELINLDTMCNTFSYGTIDMLYPFMNNLASIDFKQQSNITIYDPVPSNKYNGYNILILNDLFVNNTEGISPENLTVIKNFTISNSRKRAATGSDETQIFDFTGMFDNDKSNVADYKWKEAYETGLTLQNFMNLMYTVNTDFDASSVNTLFCNIVPTYIVNSFAGFLLNGARDSVNIFTMFNWELVKERTINLYCESYTGQSNIGMGGLNIDKTCTYDEFHIIWDNLLQSESLKSLTSLFTNCTIKLPFGQSWDNRLFTLIDILDDEHTNESITTIPSLFKSLKLMNGDDTYASIDITSSLFRCLKNIKYVPSIFEGTKMKHAIPFDIFAKRKKSDTFESGVYVKISDTGTDNDYVNARIISYDYNTSIDNMSNAFYNITFDSPELATFRNAEYNVYDRNYAEPIIETSNEYDRYKYYKKIGGVWTEYNVEQPLEIQDMDKLWVDHTDIALIETNVMEPESLIPNVYRGPQIVWWNENLQQYLRSFNDYSTQAKPYTNLTNFCNYDTAGFVVSPDIFRCCSKNCSISSSLSYEREGDNNDPIIMNGMMPPSIFQTSILKNFNFSGVFHGLNVVPIELPYRDTETIDVATSLSTVDVQPICTRHNTYYQYILSNFTENNILSECFNFMLLMPSSRSEFGNVGNYGRCETHRYSQHFIMFGVDSFNYGLIKMNRSLPIDYANILQDRSSDFMHNHYLSDNAVYFNISREFAESGGTTIFRTGINKAKYPYFIFDEFMNGDIAKILEGYVMANNTAWIPSDNLSENTVVFYQVGSTNNAGFTGLSSNARLQVPNDRGGWFPKMGNNYNFNKSSFPEGFDYTVLNDTNVWNGYTANELVYRMAPGQ